MVVGYNIAPGKLNREVYMAGIAPTLSAILNIQRPLVEVHEM
jgi:hypothetical protein